MSLSLKDRPIETADAVDSHDASSGIDLGQRDEPSPEAVAASGLHGTADRLPHFDLILQSFGHHDLSKVRAHVGGAAAASAEQLGARAFAFGDDIGFASSPDLHTAAHEAAHVVQQRSGVQLSGGIDGGVGDPYELHADAVADAVVTGRSAEALLDSMAGSGGGPAVQRKSAGRVRTRKERRFAHSPGGLRAGLQAVIEYIIHQNGLLSVQQVQAQFVADSSTLLSVWNATVYADNAQQTRERAAFENLFVNLNKMLATQATFGPIEQVHQWFAHDVAQAGMAITQGDAGYLRRRGDEIAGTLTTRRQLRSRSSTSRSEEPHGEGSTRQRAGSGELDGLLTMLEQLEKVEVLAPINDVIEPARNAVKNTQQSEAGQAVEWTKLVSKIGAAVFKMTAKLMNAMIAGDNGALEAVEQLERYAKYVALPGTFISIADAVSKIARGKSLAGKDVGSVERWFAFFELGRSIQKVAEAASVIRALTPFIEVIGRRVAWANPIAAGVEVAYAELEFCAKHVYGPAHEQLMKFFSSLRTGGDPDAILAGLRIRGVGGMDEARTFVHDVAPPPVGGGRVFGDGVVGLGWQDSWARWYAEATRPGGELHPYHRLNYAQVPTMLDEDGWIRYANAVRHVAIAFIEHEKRTGKIGDL